MNRHTIRVRDSQINKMFYQESDMNNILLYWDSIIWISRDWYWNCRNIQTKYIKIMYYTTIQDRKWNHIFEWDIMRNWYWEQWVVMFWNHRITVEEYDWQYTIWYYVSLWCDYDRSLTANFMDWEVIWNIYQNSELMSEK